MKQGRRTALLANTPNGKLTRTVEMQKMTKSTMVEFYERDSQRHGHGFGVERLVKCNDAVPGCVKIFCSHAKPHEYSAVCRTTNCYVAGYGKCLSCGI